MTSENIGDLLESAATSNEKKGKKAKTGKEAAPAKKAKTGKEAAPAKKAKTGKEAAPAKKAKTGKEAEPKREKKVDPNISMTQPEDNVVLKAVRRLKEPTMASKFSADLGVHRRVIRAQLQRLAKDKANGVGMKKDGPHWIVSNTAK